ncbi:UbiA family prenyltransferase [Archaeoglobus veneficus]|uniref:UbiA family prenyltransferase n=1 Tax=Archaeoglobus veneficus TaxID=58290 RepID=UPI0018DAF822|nr:UbiA family prenyltransferase [Archaeoglobus veneficus]
MKLSATPATIIYPYPFLAFLVFSLSGTLSLISLIKAIIISFLFYAGINLWNHVNDVKEDVLAGKKNILTENENVRMGAAALSAFLYVISFILSAYWIIDKKGIIAFTGAAIATWIYSDRMVLGKMIRRWKDYYVTEVLAYIISAPSITLLLWTLFAPISPKAFALSVIMTLFLLPGAFLKDIKDISSDRLAGLKTLGVVFSPQTLLKVSLLLLSFYYLSILVFSITGVFPSFCAFSLLSFLGLIYTIKYFLNNKWAISPKSVKPIKIMVYSNLISLLILIVAGITQTLPLPRFHLN